MSYLVYFFDTRTLYTSLILVPCIFLKNTSSTERCALMLPSHPDVRVTLPLHQLILVHRILGYFAHMYVLAEYFAKDSIILCTGHPQRG